MRVLVTSPVFPPELGGPAVYVPSLGRFLAERGHDVRVIAFGSDPAPQGYPFAVETIPPGPLPVRYLRAFWRVLRAAGSVDVVYVNEHLALLHVLAGRLRRTPVVIRIMVDGSWEIAHRYGWCGGDDIVAFQEKRYGLRVALTRALQRWWWRRCARIICCSEFLRQILIRHHGVPEEQAVRIFNAYHGPAPESVTASRAEARRLLDLPADGRIVLTICRLMVWKRVDGILEALRELPDDVQLLVAGDGDMDAEWQRLAGELGVADRVRWLGNVPHDRIPLLIRAADVFVLNSEYEGLSHTLLEVLHLGTPILASHVCGNPEVVEDEVSGLLVDPRDPETLHAALSRVLDDPELGCRLAAAALARRGAFDRETTFGAVEAQLARAAGVRAVTPADAGAR